MGDPDGKRAEVSELSEPDQAWLARWVATAYPDVMEKALDAQRRCRAEMAARDDREYDRHVDTHYR